MVAGCCVTATAAPIPWGDSALVEGPPTHPSWAGVNARLCEAVGAAGPAGVAARILWHQTTRKSSAPHHLTILDCLCTPLPGALLRYTISARAVEAASWAAAPVPVEAVVYRGLDNSEKAVAKPTEKWDFDEAAECVRIRVAHGLDAIQSGLSLSPWTAEVADAIVCACLGFLEPGFPTKPAFLPPGPVVAPVPELDLVTLAVDACFFVPKSHVTYVAPGHYADADAEVLRAVLHLSDYGVGALLSAPPSDAGRLVLLDHVTVVRLKDWTPETGLYPAMAPAVQGQERVWWPGKPAEGHTKLVWDTHAPAGGPDGAPVVSTDPPVAPGPSWLAPKPAAAPPQPSSWGWGW